MLSPYLDFITLDSYNALYLACQYDSIGIALELMKSQIFQRKLEQVDRGKLRDIFPSSSKRSVFMFHLYWSQIRLILGFSLADGEYWLPKEVVGHLIYLFCASRVSSVQAIEQDRTTRRKGKKETRAEKDRTKEKGKDNEKEKDIDKDRDKPKRESRLKGKPKAKYEQRLSPSQSLYHQEQALERRHKQRFDKEKDRDTQREKDKKKLRNIFPLQKRTRKSEEANKTG